MKVAICFSGAIRNFDDCISSTLKYFINNFNNPDIFLHMWTFTNKDDTDENNIKYNFKWRKDDSSIEKIIKILEPKKYVIEEYTSASEELIIKNSGIDMNKFDTEQKRNYGFNCCSMYWKILKSFELAEEFGIENGFEYDLVIRARLDFLWEDYIKQINFTDITDNKIFLIKDRYASCSRLITNDKFFAGNFNTMKKMCEIFKCLKKYQDEGIMIEGQTINEIHIKKNNFKVKWIGHSKTYYKFMGRHKVISNNTSLLIKLDNFLCSDTANNELSNELVYKFLDCGYKVSCNNSLIQNYNTINNNFIINNNNFVNQEIKYDIEITNYFDGNNNIITVSKNKHEQKKLIFSDDLMKLIQLNFSILIDFIQCLVSKFDNISIKQFNLDKPLQINLIEPKEIVRYKHMDHGYYLCDYISFENNNHLIWFDKKNIKVSRELFKIINLVKYYQEGIIPIN